MKSEQSYFEYLMSPERKPSYVVYAVGSTVEKKSYKRKSDAMRLAAKLNARSFSATELNDLQPDYAVAERLEYEFEVVYDRQVENLRFGGKVWEKSNLPYYLSVSSNTYWES
jgi:hypothetical protein